MTASKSDQQFSNAGAPAQSQREALNRSKNPVLPSLVPRFVNAGGDPQEGNLATPINSSPFTRWFINQLPGYRPGVSPFQRGLQVGLAHGFWLLCPFVALGPLRDTKLAVFAGLSATIGLLIIATLAIAVYAESAPPPPIATLTTPNPPSDLTAPQGWQALARGFLFGGVASAVFAAVLVQIFSL